jgi:Icc-related predicted phosphoesterase
MGLFWKKNKKAGGEKLTIFFASDLHGSAVCFKKFVNAAKFYGADALVMGGDLTGKAVIPITEQSDGSFKGFQTGQIVTLKTQDEVDDFVKRVDNQGFYPTMMSEQEFQDIKDDIPAQEALFKRLVIERVAEWCEYAGQKLQGTGIPLITSPGNDDFFEIDDVLGGSPHVQYHEMEITELGGYEVLHCGGSTRTPWDTEREFTEEEYAARFAELVPQVKDMSRCIFNVHVPPMGTVLDQCPKLDDKLQVVFDMGNPVSMHAGCQALNDTIAAEQPLLGLHGHIHEGRGKIKIGKTTCVNPGSVYPEGILQGVLVTLRGGEVDGVQLTQG